MRDLELIEERMRILARALITLSGVVEESTNPAVLREAQARFEEISAEIAQLERDTKLTLFRMRQGL